jgi:hypothetical protein
LAFSAISCSSHQAWIALAVAFQEAGLIDLVAMLSPQIPPPQGSLGHLERLIEPMEVLNGQ